MLGRGDKSNAMHIKARGITGKISITVVLIIMANYCMYIVDSYISVFKHQNANETLSKWTAIYLPNIFLGADCILLGIGLVWIFKSLRHDKQVMGNEKFMLLHSVLLSLTLGSQIFV
jgi:hypothetical protein